MKETEITVQILNSLDEIDSILTLQGYKRIRNFTLDDFYYSHFDDVRGIDYQTLISNSFMIRHAVSNNKESIELTYKNKEIDQNGNVISEEKIKTSVGSLKDAKMIFEMSHLNCYCEVKNTSYVYSNSIDEFAIQVIDNLGIFLEFEENESMQKLTTDEKINVLKTKVNSLKLTLGNDYSVKKVYLLLNK